MKKILITALMASFVFVAVPQLAQAETNLSNDVLVQVSNILKASGFSDAADAILGLRASSLTDYVCPAFSRHLTIGSSGSDVSSLQSLLKEKGYFNHSSVTSYFGPLTEGAVKKFQAAEGIVSSGNAFTTGFGSVGPSTRSALSRYCNSGSTVDFSFSMSVASPTTGQSVGETIDVSGSGYGTPTSISANGVEGEIKMIDDSSSRVAATYEFVIEDVPVWPLNSLIASKYNGYVEVEAEGYTTDHLGPGAPTVLESISQTIKLVLDEGDEETDDVSMYLEKAYPRSVAVGDMVNLYGKNLQELRKVSILDGFYIFEVDNLSDIKLNDDGSFSFILPERMQGTCGIDVISTVSGGVLDCFVADLPVEVGTYELVVEDSFGVEYGPVKFEVISKLSDSAEKVLGAETSRSSLIQKLLDALSSI